MDPHADTLPPPIDQTPTLKPVMPASGRPGGEPAAADQATPVATVAPKVAKLDFIGGGERVKTVPLSCPFHYEGTDYHGLTVQRLTINDVGDLCSKGLPDIFEVYARMAGLPASVLRGLDADDGGRFAEVAAGFLPPLLQRAYGFTSPSATGEKSPAA